MLGVGTVGSELLDIIRKESPRGISVHAVGSSKKMLIGKNMVNRLRIMMFIKKCIDEFEYRSKISYSLITFYSCRLTSRHLQLIVTYRALSGSI